MSTGVALVALGLTVAVFICFKLAVLGAMSNKVRELEEIVDRLEKKEGS